MIKFFKKKKVKSPLNQFAIFNFLSLNFFDIIFLNINNINLVIFGVCLIGVIVFNINAISLHVVPKRIQYIYELIFIFLYKFLFALINKKGLIYFPFLFTIFVIILLLNIVSLLPFSFAVTSHFIWSLYLSISICFGIFIIGLINYQLDYLRIFILNVPFILQPLMLIIELASYVIRAFSLGIRLSANILAGHLLVDIIADLIVFLNSYLIDLSFLVLSLLIALYFLEIGVACLQAYVFLLLVSLYLRDGLILQKHV